MKHLKHNKQHGALYGDYVGTNLQLSWMWQASLEREQKHIDSTVTGENDPLVQVSQSRV